MFFVPKDNNAVSLCPQDLRQHLCSFGLTEPVPFYHIPVIRCLKARDKTGIRQEKPSLRLDHATSPPVNSIQTPRKRLDPFGEESRPLGTAVWLAFRNDAGAFSRRSCWRSYAAIIL